MMTRDFPASDLAGVGVGTRGLDDGLLDQNRDLLGGIIIHRNAADATGLPVIAGPAENGGISERRCLQHAGSGAS